MGLYNVPGIAWECNLVWGRRLKSVHLQSATNEQMQKGFRYNHLLLSMFVGIEKKSSLYAQHGLKLIRLLVVA